MRNTFLLTFLAALFLSAGCATYDRELMGDPEPTPPVQQVAAEAPAPGSETGDSLGVGMFDELDYYGQWYQVDPYGWVWRPTVVMGWQPFLNGHWIWSQYGWLWIDYDPWGWATSHYGYWTTDFTLGWVWIPDYQWSPAQVDWMLWDDWACWSPVPAPGSQWKYPWEDTAWVSVPVRRFKETNIGDYRTTPKFKTGESDRTLIRTAPDVREIEKHGPRFSRVEVQLDRRVVGEREFAKIKLPPDQEQIVRDHRTVTSGGAAYQPPSAVGNGGNNSTVVPGSSQPERVKSKDPGSTNSKSSSTKKETRYKEKKSGEKSKSGEKKPAEKSDDGKKDDGTSKDTSKSGKKNK